ncbi:hypothetical protein ACJZ2D_002444 [Fusarium nematophilum]
MADAEMDIEISNPRGFDNHVDDIIDYDTDMVDHHDQASNTGHPQKQDEATEAMDRDMKEAGDSAGHDSYQTNGMMSEDVDFDLHDVEDTEDYMEEVDHEPSEGAGQKHEAENTSQSFIRGIQGGEEYVEASNKTGGNEKNQDEWTSAHEIDYELDDHVEKEEPHEEAYDAANSDNSGYLEASGAENVARDDLDESLQRSGDDTGVAQTDPYRKDRDPMGQHEPVLNESENHEHREAAPRQDEVAGLGSAEDQVADKLSEAAPEDGENYDSENPADPSESATHEVEPPHQDGDGVENAEGAEDNAYDEAKGNWEEHDEDREAASLEPADLSTAGDNGDNSTEKFDNEFPAITSTQGELMSSVTFRQVLEIFDLLVKNQDPDSSRTLFTYLFTKPNTEKRLESLIDSATAGKGLDEVIHLFQSPMPASSSILEANKAIDGLHEELDGFDSPAEEDHPSDAQDPRLDEEHPEGDDPDADLHPSNDGEEDDQDDHEAETEPRAEIRGNAPDLTETILETNNDSDAAAVDDGSEENGNAASLSFNFPLCYSPEFCLCGTCVAEYIEDHNREEAEFRQTLVPEQWVEHCPRRQDISAFPHVEKEHAQSCSELRTTFSFQEADEFSPAPNGSEPDPFANLELDDSTGLDDAVDLGDGPAAGEHVTVEKAAVHAPTNGTSTTTTLRDEDEAGSINVDLGADVDAEGTTEGVEAVEENDLDEIDWRDQPEANDGGPGTPSAAGKRARGDDDGVDAEDEQDVKRRRP